MEGLKVNDQNVDRYLSRKFLANNSLSEKHAPLLKQITKTEGKTKSKPQIRTGILTSIQNKKENIQQILQSERPGTKRFTTTVQKLQKYSFKFDKKEENYHEEYSEENKNSLIKI